MNCNGDERGFADGCAGRYDGERIGRTEAGAGGVALLAGQVTRLAQGWYADDATTGKTRPDALHTHRDAHFGALGQDRQRSSSG